MACRPATVRDVTRMAELREASGWEGGADEARMRAYLLGEHHPQRALEPRVAFVAESDGLLVGFIAGHLTRRFDCDGELQWILVAPAHRGDGTADRLLEALASWFVHQGARRICVNVAADNMTARRFYARRGAMEMSLPWLVWPEVHVVVPSVAPPAAHETES